MRITTRSEWKARPPKNTPVASTLPKGSVIHHTTGTVLGADKQDDWLRNIQNYHMDHNGWNDIGYNFLVDYTGRIWEGRGWDIAGAHVLGHNKEYLGIAYMGDDAITDAAKASIRWLTEQHHNKATTTHNKLGATSCPGPVITPWVLGGMPLPQTPKPPVPPKPRPKTHPATISIGARGNTVKLAQKELNKRKKPWERALKVDGIFGPKTKKVTMVFQKRAFKDKREVDGIIGPKTWGKLGH